MAARVKAAAAAPITRIVFTPYQLSPGDWRVAVSERDKLHDFQNAAQIADATPVSRHSGPIGEWTLTLYYERGASRTFLASVHKHEPQDLFLTDTSFIEEKPGVYSRWDTPTARLPGLGSWIMAQAPQGRL